MVHRLTVILSGDEELFLGEYENFYEAIKVAQNDHLDHMVFRICEGENCIFGTRMAPAQTEMFWRIPREEGKQRGRDDRVMKVLDKVISVFKKS